MAESQISHFVILVFLYYIRETEILFSAIYKPCLLLQHDIDISAFLRCIRDHHLQPQVYTADKDAIGELKSVFYRLKEIEADSNIRFDLMLISKSCIKSFQVFCHLV